MFCLSMSVTKFQSSFSLLKISFKWYTCTNSVIAEKSYRIAGNFWGGGGKTFVVEQYFVTLLIVVAACTVGNVASFVDKIFVVRASTTKITSILPHENYQLYGTCISKVYVHTIIIRACSSRVLYSMSMHRCVIIATA